MSVIFLWLILTVLIAIWASNWEQGGFLFFVISLILSPLIAGLILLVMGRGGKKCPRCSEIVKKDAHICKHCQYEFET